MSQLLTERIWKKLSSIVMNDMPELNDIFDIAITKRLTILEKEVKILRSTLENKNNQIEMLTTYKNDLESVLYQHNDENAGVLRKLEDVQMKIENVNGNWLR